jgi:hypothetical protein
MVNLAFVKARVQEFEIQEIVSAFCVDLTKVPHIRIPRSECKLYHTNDAYDRLQHFLQEYVEEFQDMEKLFIERQPITGLVHVEQLLYGHFRDQAELVSPNSMHKWLGINTLDYEQRKVYTTQKAEPYLNQKNDWKSRERKHDMGDALCILLYVLNREKKQHKEEEQAREERERREKWNKQFIDHNQQNLPLDAFFKQFAYVPP